MKDLINTKKHNHWPINKDGNCEECGCYITLDEHIDLWREKYTPIRQVGIVGGGHSYPITPASFAKASEYVTVHYDEGMAYEVDPEKFKMKPGGLWQFTVEGTKGENPVVQALDPVSPPGTKLKAWDKKSRKNGKILKDFLDGINRLPDENKLK